MEKKKSRHVFRFPPCPTFDIEGMQGWLEALSREGLRLEPDEIYPGVFRFLRAQPQERRFRLQPLPKEKGLFGEDDAQQDIIRLNEGFSWQYLGVCGKFMLFAADDPAAPELDTDPQVQAVALKQARSRQWSEVFWSAWCLLLAPLLRLWNRPAAGVLFAVGSVLSALLALMVAWSLARGVRGAVHLGKLRKRLRLGQPLGADAGRLHARRYRMFTLAYILCWLSLGAGLLVRLDASSRTITPEEYGKPLPFLSVETTFPELGWQQDGTDDRPERRMTALHDPLVPEMIEFSERGTLESRGYCALYITYYEARWPFLARLLAQDTVRAAARRNRSFQALPLSLPDADYAAAWRSYGQNCVVQKGTRVIILEPAAFWEGEDSSISAWAQKALTFWLEADAA